MAVGNSVITVFRYRRQSSAAAKRVFECPYICLGHQISMLYPYLAPTLAGLVVRKKSKFPEQKELRSKRES